MVMIELGASLVVVALLAGLTAHAVVRYAATRDHYAWRTAAAWAAEAQVQRLLAGAPRDSLPPPGTLADNVALEQTAEPGSGDWEGFDLVTVTATVQRRHARPVRESARCYLPREVTP